MEIYFEQYHVTKVMHTFFWYFALQKQGFNNNQKSEAYVLVLKMNFNKKNFQ